MTRSYWHGVCAFFLQMNKAEAFCTMVLGRDGRMAAVLLGIKSFATEPSGGLCMDRQR